MSQHPTSYQLIELDYAVLGLLADEGTSFGYQQLGKQVRGLVTTLNESLAPEVPSVTGPMLNGRLRMMKQMGLTVTVHVLPASRGLGWQRTPKARRLLAERDAQQAGFTADELDEARR